MQHSIKLNSELVSLQEMMELETLHFLQIHGVGWLSSGQVIQRLVGLTPVILRLWKKEKNDYLYDKERIFYVQFFLHMIVDVMC